VGPVNGRLLQVLVETLGVPAGRVRDDLSMKDIESWDSLRHMSLIAAIESELDVQLDFDEIVCMRTVGAIRDVLRQHGIAC
jgi:acyl carrier protein